MPFKKKICWLREYVLHFYNKSTKYYSFYVDENFKLDVT